MKFNTILDKMTVKSLWFVMFGVSFWAPQIFAISVHQEYGKTMLSLTSEECLNLGIAAEASEDVNYVGGVDMDGNAVAPADLASNIYSKTPRFISIPIEVHLNQFLGITNPILTDFARKAEAGNVVVDLQSNQAFYNGQPLFDVPAALLEKACRDHMQSSVSSSTGEMVGW
ncbi:hypothetical protein Bealeia1_01070 [Candidatus Bealeia paramacronuclearis]|uniref:Uncharacterized protein n=1 Tax=Candidatus Bealeia paramacronuclearis TaxID=1921001 RepID=A0ABZ2C3Y9_9PROT|nr:hypothetical protein [Candidatus Bealeia paramacronuclearis]